jgi:hypothetical protein
MRKFPEPVFDDAVDAKTKEEAFLRQKEQDLIAAREERRRRNRERMPEIAKVFDEYEAAFPGCKIIWAVENGYVVGKPPPEVIEKHRDAIERRRREDGES